jgi:hypothetical protein
MPVEANPPDHELLGKRPIAKQLPVRLAPCWLLLPDFDIGVLA